MKKFEYKTVGINALEKELDVRNKLNELGQDGWEIVSVVAFDKSMPKGAFEWLIYYEESATVGFVVFLKRELA